MTSLAGYVIDSNFPLNIEIFSRECLEYYIKEYLAHGTTQPYINMCDVTVVGTMSLSRVVYP